MVNPDADALEDFVFRAVHTDFPIRVSSGRAGAVRTVTAADFLASILQPKDHVLVPVVGDSGTGKSHLIRWIDLQLRGSRDIREVIYVRKAATNLRDIIHSLVRRLPSIEQEPYLTALRVTGSANLSSEAQRTAILNQLQLALVNDRGGTTADLDPELEEFALRGLRAMLSDPHIRKTLLVDGGFAAELAAHVFEKPEHYRPAEERREFRERDLPLHAGDLRRAATETQDFLTWLMGASDADRAVVVRIINRHIDWAIGNCLNLSGDRLIALMLDLRRHFRSSGRELVLLIEDFARLQGLDRALLQSILEQQPDLCVLRTLFAATRGFYDSLESTIKTRLTFIVDMDMQVAQAEPELDKFVVRYMNALRWGAGALQDQWEEVQEGTVDFHVPSRCDECGYKGECHSSFGAIDGLGLYPFTPQAIKTMAERAETEYKTAFNPREFLKQVVKPVALSSEALQAGAFPPPELLSGLGGRLMQPAQQIRLRRDDPQHWERRIAVLELWGGTEELKNLPTWLHTAFDLPLLKGVDGLGEREPEERPPLSTPPPVEISDGRLRELQEWQEGRAELSSGTAQALRDVVFSAIEEFIDWDNIGLARVTVFGRRGLFKPGQISFQRQATQKSMSAIRLEIPKTWEDEYERMRTTLALQGLLEAKSRGDWGFTNGVHKLACLAECLREWSDALIAQCKASDVPAGGLATPIVAFELRATLQAILDSTVPMTTDQEVLKAAFVELPADPPDFITPELTDLVSGVLQLDSQLLETARTRFAAMKGGSAGEYIDAQRLLPFASALRRRRFLPPERSVENAAERKDLADPIRSVAKRVTDGFGVALAKEATAREQLKQRVFEALGERSSQEAILQCVQRIIDAAGLLGVQGTPALLALKARFEHVAFAEFVGALRAANSVKPDVRQIRSGVGQAARTVNELIDASTALLERVASEVTHRLVLEGVDPEEKARVTGTLKVDLEGIGLQLTRYNDGNIS